MIDTIVDNKNIVDEVVSNITRAKFEKYILLDGEIDLSKVVKKQKTSNTDFHKFNLAVSEADFNGDISILECAVILLTEQFCEKGVLECFNEDNAYLLRIELSERFGLDVEVNNMDEFLY